MDKKNFDYSLDLSPEKLGSEHILSLVQKDIINIFTKMGFSIASSIEVDNDENNFYKLNFSHHHPALDSQDTFWLKDFPHRLLRTHTSNMQSRIIAKQKPPFRYIVPGRCFRNERTDATHEVQFHQFEGFLIAEDVNLAHLKNILNHFLKEFFQDIKLKTRLRPGYFPFVEPGIEIDLYNPETKSWLEVCGAGLIHPNVLSNLGINQKKYQGLAFGFGIERLASIKYNIPDIRLFFSGDIRFNHGFK